MKQETCTWNGTELNQQSKNKVMKRTAKLIILRAERLLAGKRARAIPFIPTLRTVMPNKMVGFNEWARECSVSSRLPKHTI